ncbi:MAG: NAD-dependent epimerase/dehydratase family protein [Acetobacteraceae bacterium]|nr:NAD-dependent epimerase/dehydratase family protein [Acetobacteraceae bacterium]
MSQSSARRVLITGANGFVGPYLGAALRHSFGDNIVIAATSRIRGLDPVLGAIAALDVTDAQAVDKIINDFHPSHVIHLAGLAAIRFAIANLAVAWQVHLFGTLNIANAILGRVPDCVLISVGSGQVYGASARSGQPLTETTLLAPTNGYEVTKAAADLALGALAAQGLRCIRMRPFNHTGAGQTEEFVIPSFVMQIARIEAGLQAPVLRVGNLDAERDFLDVRDVTAAYTLAVEKSDDVPSGTILNIASGIPRRVRDVLDHLVALSSTAITVEPDPKRIRPSDTPRFVGDATLAQRLLGWSPEIKFDDTLAVMLEHSRNRVSDSSALRCRALD